MTNTVSNIGIPIVLLTLSACSLLNPPESAGRTLLRQAQRVPLGIAQAVTLGTQARVMNTLRLADVDDTFFLTIPAEDPQGNPAHHLVFTLDQTVNDWYAFATTLTDTTTIPSGWSTTMIGATTAHTIVSSVQSDVNALLQLRDAVNVIGGMSNFAKLISLSNSLEGLYIEATDGRWVSVSSNPEVISDATKTTLIAGFTSSADAIATNEVAEELEGNWQEILNPETPEAQAQLQAFTKDGRLNLQAARATLLRQNAMQPTRLEVKTPGVAGIQSETKSEAYCWRFLWWRICVDQYELQPSGAQFMRSMPINGNSGFTNQGLPGGFNQSGRVYGSATSYDVQGTDKSGCFASAFASQIWWFWQNKDTRFYGIAPKKLVSGVEVPVQDIKHTRSSTPETSFGQFTSEYVGDTPVTRLMARQANGYPWFTQEARGFRFETGTVITPWDFENAARRFFDQQRVHGVNLTLDSAYTVSPLGYGAFHLAAEAHRVGSYFLSIPTLVAMLPQQLLYSSSYGAYNYFRQSAFAHIIRRHMGNSKDEYVIAMYPTGRHSGFEAHYSAIMKAKVIYHTVRPEILVEPLDKFQQRDWYGLSDPMASFVGVFAINK
jgi:hypothetical protein